MIYGLIAMFGWGVSNFFSGRLSKSIGFLPALISGTVGVVVCLLVILLAGKLPVTMPQGATLQLLIVAGALLSVAGLAFYKSIEVGKISLLSPIAASWPIGVAILLIITKQSHLTPALFISMLLVVFGVCVASIKRIDKKISFSDPGVPYAIAAFAAWTGAFYLFGRTLAGPSWMIFNILFLSISVVFELFYALSKKSIITWKPNQKTILYLVSVAVPSAAAFYFYSLGMQREEKTLVSVATNANPVITALLAAIFLHERLHRRQITGIAIVLIGLILTNY